MLARLRSLARAVWHRDRLEEDLEDEVRFHLDRRADDLARSGVPREDALRQARREFGHPDSIKEACREARSLNVVDAFARDVRYAARLLRRSPAFAATVILTLSLCIGVNTAIFSVVDAVLFRPLPYPDAGRLAQVVTYVNDGGGSGDQAMTSQTGTTWEMLRDGAPLIDWATFFGGSTQANLAAGHAIEYVQQQRVSAGYFRVLGIAPLRGREFTGDEDRPGGARVAVLSHALWQRVYDRAWPVPGTLLLAGAAYTVVGVMPAGFASGVSADVWTPLRPTRTGEGAGENYTVIGRLKPGVSWAAASASIQPIARAVSADLRARGVAARVELLSLQRADTEGVRQPLLVVLASVFVVLLIGCLNLAGLLVARSLDRVPEIATRIALGCGRAGVIRQLLVESLVLGVLGGVAALVVARLALGWLSASAVDTYGVWQPVGLDRRVLSVTALLALGTSLLFGLAPALQALRIDVRSGLTGHGGRAVARSATRWPRRVLVAGQIALCVVLVADAALLLRSFAHLATRPPGIDAANVVAATVPLQDARYTTNGSVNALFERTLTAFKSMSGVESAAVALTVPYERGLNLAFRRVGSNETQMMVLSYVTADFFRTLRIPVRRGRAFDAHDTGGTTPVVVVDESFARRYFKNADPLAERLQFGGGNPRITWSVVGVVGNVQRRASLSGYEPVDALPSAYILACQMPPGFTIVHNFFSPSWLVRTTFADPGLQRRLAETMATVEPQLPFASFRRIEDVKGNVLAPQRVQAALLGSFSLLAVLLAAVGLFGLAAKTVAERTRELGIRVALGCSPIDAVRVVAMPIVALAAIGVGIGCVLTAGSAQLLRHEIWGIRATDPLSVGGAAIGLVAVAVAVTLAGTWRVARLDPAQTLRRE
ncbi:MAG: ADOP family duplicated permease [Bacteroidales bacterium]